MSRDGSTITVGSYDGSVYTMRTSDGSPVWNVSVSMGVGEGTPALVGDCFVVCGIRDVVCLSASDGSSKWSWTPGGQVASCGAYDATRDLIFVGTLDKQLWAAKASDGTPEWRYDAGGEIWATHGPRLVGDDAVCSGIGGEAYVHGNCSATIDCVDRDTGALVWKRRTGIQIQSTPSVGELQLYVGDYDDCLYAFDAKTGDRHWRVCTAGRLESSSAVFSIAGVETVAVGSGDGSLYAFRGDSGALTWKTKLGDPVSTFSQGGVGSSPLVLDGVIYVGGPDAFFALDAATGAVNWKHDVGKMVGSSPVARDGVVYVGAEDGYLYAFEI